jgi:hypothetical protein
MWCCTSRPGLTSFSSPNLYTIVFSFSVLGTRLQYIYFREINQSECQSWFSFGRKFKFNFNSTPTCLTKYYWEDEMGGACVTYGWQPEEETPREIYRNIWDENYEINLKNRIGYLDWVFLAQVWNTLHALVKRVTNYWGSIKRSKFLDAEAIFASQEGLCSVELTDIYSCSDCH